MDFIIGDAHYPYQDPASIKIVMKMVATFKPDNVIMAGDMLDCATLSRFTIDPPEPAAFKSDVEELCGFISDIQEYSTVHYVQGNHESRLSKVINDKMPELYGMLDMQSIINSNLDTDIEYTYNVPAESMIVWNDDLLIGHFNKTSQNCCYTVKLLIDRFKTNICQAHTHRLGEYRVRGQRGTLRGWESGCLCDLNPSYALIPNWQNGFLVYERLGNSWNIETVPIDDGKAMYRGKVYR